MNKIFLYFLSCSITFGQGFGLTTPAFHGLVVRPPSLWVDVAQCLNTNANDASHQTNLVDFSGHGILLRDSSQDGSGGTTVQCTNFLFFNRFGGIISGDGNKLGGMTHTYLPGGGRGWDDIGDVTSQGTIIRSNRFTCATRVQFRDTSTLPNIFKTSSSSVANNYLFTQIVANTWYYDCIDSGAAGGRINKAEPSDYLNAWINVFWVRNGTNADIWINGTNWLSGRMTIDIDTLGNGGVLSLWQACTHTNFYIKRTITWDYPLSPADIDRWNRYMTYLP